MCSGSRSLCLRRHFAHSRWHGLASTCRSGYKTLARLLWQHFVHFNSCLLNFVLWYSVDRCTNNSCENSCNFNRCVQRLSEPLFEASFFSQQVARTWVKKTHGGDSAPHLYRTQSGRARGPLKEPRGSFKRFRGPGPLGFGPVSMGFKPNPTPGTP